METLRQIGAVCVWNVRSITGRARSALVLLTGFFAVVLVFVAVLSIREGLEQSLGNRNLDDVAIVYGQSFGSLPNDAVKLMSAAPGIARSPQGPRIAGTLFGQIALPKWGRGLYTNVAIRGVDAGYARTIPEFHIVKGRMFRPGQDEIVVGAGAAKLFDVMHYGKTLQWFGRTWKIVGIYETGNALRDAESIADLNQVRSLRKTGRGISSIYVRLTSPQALAQFKQVVEGDPRLHAVVERLSSYEHGFTSSLQMVIAAADAVITALMAAGAVFGALNVMYANVAARKSEMATLRALGFGRMAVLVAVLSEALVLSLIGGGLGVLAAYILFNGYEAATSVGGELTQFRFAVTPAAVGLALLLTLAMGLLGGLLPAIRAARMPLARALRDA